MSYVQVRPFNQAQGGTTPNMCLNNVRLGYGIANKYGSATEAWQHTQQHADRNVPAGLAVPLYYSYTTTIDGVTQNYGHINVRLPNGTVWSDGNIYANIDAYTANHYPKFVGWGESVNDATIIQGSEEPMLNSGDIDTIYRTLYNRPPDASGAAYWPGKPFKDLIYAILNSDEYKQGHYINPGDAINIGKAVKADASSLVGTAWDKQTFYGFMQPNLEK